MKSFAPMNLHQLNEYVRDMWEICGISVVTLKVPIAVCWLRKYLDILKIFYGSYLIGTLYKYEM